MKQKILEIMAHRFIIGAIITTIATTTIKTRVITVVVDMM